MVRFCDKCGAELKTENARFCDKCGAKVKFAGNTQSNANALNIPINVEEKSMAVALLISFIFSGLGMAYAGNVMKGVGYFVGSIIIYIFMVLIFRSWIVFLITIIIWAVGLALTYQEVNEYNQQRRMAMMNF